MSDPPEEAAKRVVTDGAFYTHVTNGYWVYDEEEGFVFKEAPGHFAWDPMGYLGDSEPQANDWPVDLEPWEEEDGEA